MKTEENKKTRLGALIATGVLGTFLLGSTSFLYLENSNLKDENSAKKEQLDQVTIAKAKLQSELQSINAELASYKGKNRELDKLLSSAYRDLKVRKERINKLLKQNASLSKYKKEAEALRKLKKGYLSRIEKMEKRISELSGENSELKENNQKLTSELEELHNNYMILERKVEIASILKVDKVIAIAEKKSKHGKYSKVSSSKKADRMFINFELSENKVADAGVKNVYIRVIDPSGKVLPAPASEKGFFSNPDGNIEMPYSIQKGVNYNNQNIKSSVSYEIGQQDLKGGAYTIEFYCEGHFCGASKYILK